MSRSIPLSVLLRQHRLNNDLTLEGLAERAGVSDRTIGDIERGVSLAPQRHTVAALADALALDDSDRADFVDAARAGRRLQPARAMDVEATASLRPHSLPDFTGREGSLALLMEMTGFTEGTARPGAPIVISGAAGVGKTTLAVEVSRRGRSVGYRELFLDLQGVGAKPLTPIQVLHGLLSQLSGRDEVSRSFSETAAAWADATEVDPIAVVLDDASMEAQVRPVLTGGDRLRVLVTSRRTLAGIEGARHLALGPYRREESLAFLDAAIPQAQRAAGGTDELAGLCGDLPLALRVAAGRISSHPTRSVRGFVEQLRTQSRRLQLLVAGDIAVEGAFNASYTLLSAESRNLFRLLALLTAAPTFSAATASGLLGSDLHHTEDLLEDLVDLGMVESLRGGRYRLHELMRLFATRRLGDELTAAQIDDRERQFDGWLLATAAQHGDVFDSPVSTADETTASSGDEELSRQWLTSEAAYWYAALQRAAKAQRHQEVLDAGTRIRWFADRWLEWGHWHELWALLAQSARAVGDPDTEALALGMIAYMHLFETFDYERAGNAAREALNAAIALDNPEYRGTALTYLAGSAIYAGRPEDAVDDARDAVAVFVEAGDLERELHARHALAAVYLETDPAAALTEYESMLAITADASAPLTDYHRSSNRDSAMNGKARALVALRRFEDAVRVATDLFELSVTDESYQARALRHRGIALLGLGRGEQARADLHLALERAGDHRPDEWAAEIEAALTTIDSSTDDAP